MPNVYILDGCFDFDNHILLVLLLEWVRRVVLPRRSKTSIKNENKNKNKNEKWQFLENFLAPIDLRRQLTFTSLYRRYLKKYCHGLPLPLLYDLTYTFNTKLCNTKLLLFAHLQLKSIFYKWYKYSYSSNI